MYRSEPQQKAPLYNLQIHALTQVVKQKRLPNACYSSCSVVHLNLTGLFLITLILPSYHHSWFYNISYKRKLSFSTPQAKLASFKIHSSSYGRIVTPLSNL